jgi:serine/threonine-protein kinase
VLVLPEGSFVPQFVRRTSTSDTANKTFRLLTSRARLLRFRRSRLFAWVCAGVTAVAAVAAWLHGRPVEQTQGVEQFEVELKSDGALAADVGTTAVLSPDGMRIIFVARNADGRTQLYTRRLDESEPVLLRETEGARGPFVSPDGRWVGFWANGKLKMTPLQGGSPIELCNADELFGASWGDGDTIVAAFGDPGKLWRIPPAGGTPEVVIDLTRESTLIRGHSCRRAATTDLHGDHRYGPDGATVDVQSIHGGARKVLVRGGTFGRYLPDGYLTYVQQGTLYAVRFDPTTFTVEGAAIPLLDDVSYSPVLGYAQVDISGAGTLVYVRGAESERSVIDWIDRSGTRISVVSKPGRYGWLRLSPDGERLALTANENGKTSVAVYDVRTGEEVRVTTRPDEYAGLAWLPDGRLVVGDTNGMAWIQSIRPSDATVLMHVGAAQIPWSVAPDGSRLAYYQRGPGTGFDLWTAPMTGTADSVTLVSPESFLRTPAFEILLIFTDGRWIGTRPTCRAHGRSTCGGFRQRQGDTHLECRRRRSALVTEWMERTEQHSG